MLLHQLKACVVQQLASNVGAENVQAYHTALYHHMQPATTSKVATYPLSVWHHHQVVALAASFLAGEPRIDPFRLAAIRAVQPDRLRLSGHTPGVDFITLSHQASGMHCLCDCH